MKIEVRLLLIEQHSVIGFKVTFCRADAKNRVPVCSNTVLWFAL